MENKNYLKYTGAVCLPPTSEGRIYYSSEVPEIPIPQEERIVCPRSQDRMARNAAPLFSRRQ